MRADAEMKEQLKRLEDEQRIANEAKEEADRRAKEAEDERQRAMDAAAQAEADKNAMNEAADSLKGDKTLLFVVIGLSVLVIIGMVVYIWRRRQNRYKFKKDEIFDEILDRGHLESDDHIPESTVLNDSFADEGENAEPRFNQMLTSQMIATNI